MFDKVGLNLVLLSDAGDTDVRVEGGSFASEERWRDRIQPGRIRICP
jgi:hypothetical protein